MLNVTILILLIIVFIILGTGLVLQINKLVTRNKRGVTINNTRLYIELRSTVFLAGMVIFVIMIGLYNLNILNKSDFFYYLLGLFIVGMLFNTYFRIKAGAIKKS